MESGNSMIAEKKEKENMSKKKRGGWAGKVGRRGRGRYM